MYRDIIINDQILLSKIKYQYAHDIVDGMQDVTIYNQTLKVPFPYFLADAIRYIDQIKAFEKKHNVQKEWVISSNGKIIGAIGLHYDRGLDNHLSEIGYWLHKDYRGRGWMSLILASFAADVFKQTEIRKLKATVFDFNIASAKSLERAGFRKGGILQNEYLKDHKMIHAISYGICK